MPRPKPHEWGEILADFEAPIAAFDCGQYCSPHNHGEPFCCSTQHAVPVVFVEEWQHLRAQSDLWHLFKPRNRHDRNLRDELTSASRLVECKGFRRCERENRSLSCRAFPFFPYVTREGDFVGLAYYWYFEDRCWVINNLQIVTREYVDQFVATYEDLFRRMPDEKEHFRNYSATMRRVFSRWRRSIPLVHRNGGYYAISSRSGRLRRATPDAFGRRGPYAQA
jgi:hypothetical protein